MWPISVGARPVHVRIHDHIPSRLLAPLRVVIVHVHVHGACVAHTCRREASGRTVDDHAPRRDGVSASAGPDSGAIRADTREGCTCTLHSWPRTVITYPHIEDPCPKVLERGLALAFHEA